MSFLLENLELSEVSLVDKAANQHASIVLYKRDNTMDIEELTKKLEELEAKLEKSDEDNATLKTQNESLRKSLLDNGFDITKDGVEKRKEEDFVEYKGEKIVKSDDRYELAAELSKAQAEKEAAYLEKRAQDTYPNLETDTVVKMLKSFDEDKDIEAFLSAVDAMFGKQFEEQGESNSDGDMKTATEKLDDLTKAYMAEHSLTKKDYAVAYAAVVKTDKGKSLVKESYKE